MEVGNAIVKILNDGATGALVNENIFPIVIPQKTPWPAISYHVISSEPTNSKDGNGHVDGDRIQIDVYSESHFEMILISKNVREDLDEKTGIFQGIHIDSIEYLNRNESRDDKLKIYQMSIDFQIRIK